MSDENTTSTEIAEPSAEAWQVLSEATEAAIEREQQHDDNSEQQENDGIANEAAKYRRRLRDTEAERDALRSRVEAMQRNEVQRLVADRLADPADVWRDGATVGDVLDDAGNIDNSKVGQLVDGLVKEHAHWAAVSTSRAQLGSRSGSGASGPTAHRQTSWAHALHSPKLDDK
jgi:hypothetical protein